MTPKEQELFHAILPLIESGSEGLHWDFKASLTDKAEIIKDILAFSNSDHTEDSYIIVGVKEPKKSKKLKLTEADRKRLNTDANFIYLPGKWGVDGLTAYDIGKMKRFSNDFTNLLSSKMLISIPRCEYVPLLIKRNRYLFVIVIKSAPGVYITKCDITSERDAGKVVVKQGVLYVRKADTTIGADSKVALAADNIRVWREYLGCPIDQDATVEEANNHGQP